MNIKTDKKSILNDFKEYIKTPHIQTLVAHETDPVRNALTYGAIGTAATAGTMGVSSLLGHDLPPEALIVGGMIGGVKGGTIVATTAGAKDSLANASLIPAAIGAASVPVIDHFTTQMGFGETGMNPIVSGALTGAAGAGVWKMRHMK